MKRDYIVMLVFFCTSLITKGIEQLLVNLLDAHVNFQKNKYSRFLFISP